MAVYKEQQYTLPQGFASFGHSEGAKYNIMAGFLTILPCLTECLNEDWIMFKGRCYSLQISHDAYVYWKQAESICRTLVPGGHLVSISSAEEMIFLHYLLTTDWMTNATKSFIGNFEILDQMGTILALQRSESRVQQGMALERWISFGLH